MDKSITPLDFPRRLRSRLIDEHHESYDEARALYNAMIDKRPRLIVPCATVEDVVAAVGYARVKNLLLAIRGGGHNGPGFGSCDGGMVIDLSPMKAIAIDSAARTVRVEPGCTQGDVDRATHAFGLAVPVGHGRAAPAIAGLTLGGGTGYLTRKYGLTIDNLIEAEVVLADGSCRDCEPDEHRRPVLGAARRRRQLRGRHELHVPGASGKRWSIAGPIFWDVAKDVPNHAVRTATSCRARRASSACFSASRRCRPAIHSRRRTGAGASAR